LLSKLSYTSLSQSLALHVIIERTMAGATRTSRIDERRGDRNAKSSIGGLRLDIPRVNGGLSAVAGYHCLGNYLGRASKHNIKIKLWRAKCVEVPKPQTGRNHVLHISPKTCHFTAPARPPGELGISY
jgi:hypothetical protein